MQNSDPIERCSICLRDEKTTSRLHAQCLPIPHFGSYANAKVATIGLNPAYSKTYHLKEVGDFGKQSRKALTETDLQDSATWQNTYFTDFNREWHPYFKALESVLGRANWHWSYASGSAVHLDLVACATKLAFGNEPAESQAYLVSNCESHFLANLSQLPCGVLLLMNGKRIFSALQKLSSNIESREQLINNFGTEGRIGLIRLGGRQYEFRAWNKAITSKTHPVFLADLAYWLHGSLREQK